MFRNLSEGKADTRQLRDSARRSPSGSMRSVSSAERLYLYRISVAPGGGDLCIARPHVSARACYTAYFQYLSSSDKISHRTESEPGTNSRASTRYVTDTCANPPGRFQPLPSTADQLTTNPGAVHHALLEHAALCQPSPCRVSP